MGRLGRWLALALLATSLVGGVAAPAAADATECSVPYARTDVVELRVDKPIDLLFDCDLREQGGPGGLQLSVTGAPVHGSAGQPQWDPDLGSHTVRYDPDDGYLGNDTLTITATDDGGSVEHVVALRMSPNQWPACDNGAFEHTRVGETIAMSTRCWDHDEQDIWQIDLDVLQPEHGEVSVEVVPDDYVRELVVTYTPDPGFTGSDYFEAGLFDGELVDRAQFLVNVSDGPWCRGWHEEVVRAGVRGYAGPYCTQPNGFPPKLRIISPPSKGTAEVSSNALIYTPDVAASGPDSFTYQAYSAEGEGNVVTQEWTVLPNAAPVCEDRSARTVAGSPVAVRGLACADPDGDEHELTIDRPPAHGTLGQLVDGTVTYTPHEGFDGTDSFSYVSTDFARTSEPATVTVVVTESEPPVVKVVVPDQSPKRAAKRGLRLRVITDEAVDVDVVVTIPRRLARRLDIPRRIGRTSDDADVAAPRVMVPFSRTAAQVLRPRQRLVVLADLVAADEWSNSVAAEARAVLR